MVSARPSVWGVIAQTTSVWEEKAVLLGMAALMGSLLVAIVIISWVDRWRKRQGGERLTPSDQLSHFRSLYEKGELSREEFDRIRANLTPKIRQELNLPPTKPAEPPRPENSADADGLTLE